MNQITGLYSGSIKFLEPDGEKTGIYKDPIDLAKVDRNGIIGDIQADRRFHGGPEKALHQYSIHSYEKIIEAFADLKQIAIPGSIGENISSTNLNDSNVNIGDVYRIGTVLVQVSQPRSPCWKINARFECHRLAKFIAQNQITGWYYRVIEHGTMTAGDEIQMQERQEHSVSVGEFTQIVTQHRPLPEMLEKLINTPKLNLEWKTRLQKRLEYLSNHQPT